MSENIPLPNKNALKRPFVSLFDENDKFNKESHNFNLKVKLLTAKAKDSLVPTI